MTVSEQVEAREQVYLTIVEGWLRDNRRCVFADGAIDDLCDRIAAALNAAAQPAAVVGWKLVPVFGEDESPDHLKMLIAGKKALFSCSEDPTLDDARKCFIAMCAAAPQPPSGETK